MTTIHTLSPRSSVRRPVNGPVETIRYGRDGAVRSRRPGPSRPAYSPTRYHGTGVAVSQAPHHQRRRITLVTTVLLALGAGLITLWLGLVANVGQALNGGAVDTGSHVPDRLAVVRVESGESLQDVAHRVAPDAPSRQVADRIRELNDLHSSNLMAGQTLIAPVG
jgi:LysM domain